MLLNHLRYFHEVGKLKSFSKAAKVLRVSQPSLSKTIKHLEEQLGTVLLDRSRGGRVNLTPLGERVMAHCERVFSEIEGLSQMISKGKAEVSGPLRLAVSDNLANYILPREFAGFLKQFPKMALELFTGSATAIQGELITDRSEIGLFYTQLRSKELQLEKVAEVEFYLVSKKPMTVDEIQNQKYIGSRIQDYEAPNPAMQMLRAIGVEPNDLIETNNQEVQKRLVLAGLGYSVLPGFMAREEIARKQLFRIRTKTPLKSPVFLATRTHRTLSRPAELASRYIGENIQGWLSKS